MILSRNWKERLRVYSDAASFTEIDAQVLAVQPPLSDAEIVVEQKMYVMITTLQSKLKMNLCIAPTETILV